MEIWRDIKGYEGKYQISDLGRIKSFYGKEKILNPKPDKDGYLVIGLCNNSTRKFHLIHRLVAETFIPNPNNLPEVNHKIDDYEHRSDNRVENLEWCTREYNCNYGNRNVKISESNKGKKCHSAKKKKVICITTNKTFDSVKEAADFYRIKGNGNSICYCCKGKYKSAGKHPITGEKLVWEYLD